MLWVNLINLVGELMAGRMFFSFGCAQLDSDIWFFVSANFMVDVKISFIKKTSSEKFFLKKYEQIVNYIIYEC